MDAIPSAIANNDRLVTDAQREAEGPFVVAFSGMLWIGDLERVLWKSKVPPNVEVLLDLNDVTHIETTALTFLAALIAKFESEGRRVVFNFPSSKKVRDFMRLCAFQSAVETISSGKSLRHLTTPSTHEYWGENESKQRTTKLIRTSRAGRYVEVEDVLSKQTVARYWPFQLIERDKTVFADAIAFAESDFWSAPFMLQVMNEVLGANGEYLAKDIVFEAMANAVRHPGATKIACIATSCSDPNGRPAHFTCTWWDDGKSIVDTLRAPLTNGENIIAAVGDAKVEFDLKVTDHEGAVTATFAIDQALKLSATDDDVQLLIGAILPGITCDPGAVAAIIPNEIKTRRGSSPGMGLHMLIGAAVGIYGGTVSFRTKNLFLNIKPKKKPRPNGYDAKIIRYPEWCEVPGNMVTVRLPVPRV